MNSQKTCLVVIYNHNFEQNIPIIRKIYNGRFSHIIQLMPFYSGNDSDVVRVFGNSFQFHSYIAQARSFLTSLRCERFLFIGDDLVLNPALNEQTLSVMMNLGPYDCFYPKFHDVSTGDCLRGTIEAHNFELVPAGVDASVMTRIPSVKDAFRILNSKGLMNSMCLSRIRPYFPLFTQPIFPNLYSNYKTLRARVWHIRNALRYRFKPKTASYPVVFGYSDIFSVPTAKLSSLCDTLEVFASIRMFVELAIPTALALTDWKIIHESDITLNPLNVWFPQDPKLFNEKEGVIKTLEQDCDRQIDLLAKHFPKDYLYMHPVKLSRWN